MSEHKLTSTRVAELLGVTASSVKRWADEGLLVCERTAGGHRRFLASEVARFRENGLSHTEQDALTPTELNMLHKGVIGLDDTGVVTSYNERESQFSGLDPADAVGMNFFTEIAPCCNNSLIYGAFRAGVATGEMNVRIEYTFTYRVAPTNVILHLTRDQASGKNWLVVEPL